MAEVDVHVHSLEGGNMPTFWSTITVNIAEGANDTFRDRSWLLVHGIAWVTVADLILQLRENFERSKNLG